VKAASKVIVVPTDYQTVAAAIGNATDGDTIVVKSGTYNEPAWGIGKSLKITSEIPYQARVVFHPQTYIQTIQFSPINTMTTMLFKNSITISTDNVKISGFVITNAPMDFPANSTEMGEDDTGLVSVNGNQIQITDNIFGTEKNSFHLSLAGSGNQALRNVANAISVTGSNQTISNNSVLGIDVSGSFNSITKNSAGGLFIVGDNNTVAGNSFASDLGGGGIELVNANYNIFSDNTIISTVTAGIGIGYGNPAGGSHNLFSGNIVEGATSWGVLVGNGSYNVFYGNLIAKNVGDGHDGYGVALGGVDVLVNNNLFYGNIFMNNSKNFGTNWEVLGSNAFDNGTIGNYWDDYLTKYPGSIEVDHSGIGNIPYFVYGNVNDNYPLINMPSLPKKITLSPWSAAFSAQLTPSKVTPSIGDNGTTETSSSSSGAEDNKMSSSSSEPDSWVLPTEVIVASTVVGVLSVAAMVYLKKRKR
jgi:hypothetical protein